MNFNKKAILVSGKAPGLESGTSRFLSYLANHFKDYQAELLSSPLLWKDFYPIANREKFWRRPKHYLAHALKKIFFQIKLQLHLKDSGNFFVFLHPQSLGWERSLHLLKKTQGRNAFFVLDNFFFCARSYNHIPTEYEACFRCLGGHFQCQIDFQCESPESGRGRNFQKELWRLFEAKDFELPYFLCQNHEQLRLLRAHLGEGAQAEIVGLWTVDFEENSTPLAPALGPASSPNFDVVFHGYDLASKGIQWALELAALSPQLRFLFPIEIRRPELLKAPSNCHFISMTWESGLKEAVSRARCTLVPSLWSAPIEGALIKSLFLSPLTAVVEADLSFSHEIPSDVLLKLPKDPKVAASMLAEKLQNGSGISKEALESWKKSFSAFNGLCYERVLKLDRFYLKNS